MKISSVTITALTLALALTAQAQIGSAAPRVEPLRPIRMDTPVFPQRLLEEGFREGNCRVAIGVSRDGKLDDVLAIEYTNQAFADATLAAVKGWTFEPAKFNGIPVDAATEVEVKFAAEGTVVVSVTSFESLSARIHSLILGNPDLYRPRTLHELDRIPTPITTTTPHYPKRLTQPGTTAQVAVTFFIDENGAVRLPSVDENQDPELAGAAIEALRSWKFEPATCKGRPVLVQATQTFTFHAPAKTTASNG
jgi:TonB family protein